MKRFIETNRWRDPWFRKLSPTAKHLWQWLCDNCDNAGVVEVDVEAAAFDIGEPIDEKHFSEISSRFKALPNGKLWLVKFIGFQYGNLSAKCVPHLRVTELLQSHGIIYPDCPSKSTTLVPTLVPTLSPTLNKERDKDKDKEGEKEGGAGGNKSVPDPFIGELFAAYRRDLRSALTYLEQSALAEIVRDRPRHLDEWQTLKTLKVREPRYFPQSLSKLLTTWQETLDRANSWVAEAPAQAVINGALTVIQGKELERIIERMKTIRSTYGDHQTWADEDKEEFIKLRTRKAELKATLGVVA